MKIEVLKMNKMQETGESLLQLIQNNTLPTLDIFTREVVQNSLDAASDDFGKSYVEMDFDIGDFNVKDFSVFTPEIEKNLNDKFNEKEKFIAVRDLYTVGLTGPVHDDEVVNYNYGNLLKLVYNISKKQEQDGSGGSWGLGKTVYFRLGIGLVIYYSRIKISSGSYESRLAITLIEDEKKSNTLIDKNRFNNYTGVAWWGEHYKNTESACPLCDEKVINQFLKVFNITPYIGLETGTTIIIPFLDEEGLLDNARGVFGTKHQNLPWLSSVDEYLRVSLQRWYTPRLNSRYYVSKGIGKKYLLANINGEALSVKDYNPIFRIIRELYSDNDDYFEDFESKPYTKEIRLMREFKNNSLTGVLRFIKVNKKDLGMLPPINELSPYLYCNENECTEENLPIICFTRKPGMIVAYDMKGVWSNRIGPFDDNHFVIAIFKPNSNAEFINPIVVRGKVATNLEAYLRGIEYGDHTSWQDISGKNIVGRIQTQIRNHINKEFKPVEAVVDVPTSNLVGRQLADAFLPKSGFGRSGHIRGGGVTPKPVVKRVSKSGMPTLHIENTDFENGDLVINANCFCGNNKKEAILEVFIDTETGDVNSASWEKDLDMEFPLEIESLQINSIRNERMQTVFAGSHCMVEREVTKIYDLNFVPLKTKKYNKIYGIKIIKPDIKGVYVDCTVKIKFANTNVKGTVKIWEEK